jgi:protein gp37
MSAIQWTDVTDNLIYIKKPDGTNGGHWCRKISEGCANCYAEKLNKNPGFFSFASGLPYAGAAPEGLTFDVEAIVKWKRVKTPKKRFVCSMTDLFGDWVPEAWQHLVLDAAIAAPKQTIQLLTKRPGIAVHSIKRYLDIRGLIELPSNIWVGTTIENEAALNERSEDVRALSAMARVTWISYEPALEPVDFYSLAKDKCFDWIVVGGESGAKARPCEYRSLTGAVETVRRHNIPVFVKQMGQNPVYDGQAWKLRDRKGGDFSEFPKELQYREFPVIV